MFENDIVRICKHLNTTPEFVFQKQNNKLMQKRNWVEKRQIVQYCLWKLNKKATLVNIAHATHVHAHTYVIYGKRCVENRMQTDKIFYNFIKSITDGETA